MTDVHSICCILQTLLDIDWRPRGKQRKEMILSILYLLIKWKLIWKVEKSEWEFQIREMLVNECEILCAFYFLSPKFKVTTYANF